MKCQTCGRVESPTNRIMEYNRRELCVRCLSDEYLNGPVFGEKKHVTRIKCEAWLDGNRVGYGNGKNLWLTIGTVCGTLFFGLLFLASKWLG